MINLLDKHRRQLAVYLYGVVLLAVAGYSLWLYGNVHSELQQRDRERFWYEFTNNSSSGVLVVDANSCSVVDWNTGMEVITGWSKAEVLGYPLDFLWLDPEYRKLHHRMLRDRATQEKSLHTVFRVYATIYTRQGLAKPIILTVRGFKRQSHLYVAIIEPLDNVVEIARRAGDSDMVLEQAQPPSAFGPRLKVGHYWD